jgi:hypothetical protein
LAIKSLSEEGVREVEKAMEKEELTAYVASIRSKIRKFAAPAYSPTREDNLFNTGTAFLCKSPGDVRNMRQLVASQRMELAEQISGCTSFTKTVEVELIDRIGVTLKVRYVSPENKMFVLFADEDSFRDKNEWSMRACHVAGNSWSDCLDVILNL